MNAAQEFSHYVIVNISRFRTKSSDDKVDLSDNHFIELNSIILGSGSLEVQSIFCEYGQLPADSRPTNGNVCNKDEVAFPCSSLCDLLNSFSDWLDSFSSNDHSGIDDSDLTIIADKKHRKSEIFFSDDSDCDCPDLTNNFPNLTSTACIEENTGNSSPTSLAELSTNSKVNVVFWPKTELKNFLIVTWGCWHFQEFLCTKTKCSLPEFCHEWCDLKQLFLECTQSLPSEATLALAMATLQLSSPSNSTPPQGLQQCINITQISAKLAQKEAHFRVTNCLDNGE